MRLKDSFSCIKRISFKNTALYTFLLKEKKPTGMEEIQDINNKSQILERELITV
jgi:hypothetical protein